MRSRGEAAEPEYESIQPHSSEPESVAHLSHMDPQYPDLGMPHFSEHSCEPATDKLKQIPNLQQKGIILPVIPFYVRNNAPDLQEFLIF